MVNKPVKDDGAFIEFVVPAILEGSVVYIYVLHSLKINGSPCSPLKIGPNKKLVFPPSIFRAYVSFRKGKLWPTYGGLYPKLCFTQVNMDRDCHSIS